MFFSLFLFMAFFLLLLNRYIDGGRAHRGKGATPKLEQHPLSFRIHSFIKYSWEKLYQVTCDIGLEPAGCMLETQCCFGLSSAVHSVGMYDPKEHVTFPYYINRRKWNLLRKHYRLI
jgi:hypothetical protein